MSQNTLQFETLEKKKSNPLIIEGRRSFIISNEEVKKDKSVLYIPDKKFKCVYCGYPIKYEGSCDKCGRKEDIALGKIEEL